MTLPVLSGLRTIYVQLRDPAGNISNTAEVNVDLNVELDLEGPQIPGLSRHFIGMDKIRLQVTRPPDDDLSYYVVERNVPDIDGANWHIVELTPAIADDRDRTPRRLPQACVAQQSNCDDPNTCVPGLPSQLVLLEDRNVFLGLAHFYRVRAFDDLGNASGVSVPLEGASLWRPQISTLCH